MPNISSITNSLKRGTEIVSVFGMTEEVAANAVLKKYPAECRKIPTTEFPNRAMCPSVWVNDKGQEASFALQLPRTLLQEYRTLVANLRS